MQTLPPWFILFFLCIFCIHGADASSYLSQLRFYTYLYAAQSQTSSVAVKSSLEKRLIKHFFSKDAVEAINANEDADTQTTAEQILCPLLARMRAEEQSCKGFDSCWPGSIPEHIMQTAKWIAWFAPLPHPPPPLSPGDYAGWDSQFCQLEQIRDQLTEQERTKIATYHGHNWLDLSHSHLQELPEEKKLVILSILTKALYDGIICEMQAKYRYCVPRPYMQKPSFQPLIAPLDTPSYPSGHAIQAAILAAILSHFLPEKSTQLKAFVQEAKLIRLQEGVHFPEDVEQGEQLGFQVALRALHCGLKRVTTSSTAPN